MRKRNNQGESVTMLRRHFTNIANTNHHLQSSTRSRALVPSQYPPKQQYEPWSFPVGRNVHDRSWGKRTTCIPGNGFHLSIPWTAADFSILEKLGEGHFGSVFRAKLASAGTVSARSSSDTSTKHGQSAEQDARDDIVDMANNGSFRDDNNDTRDNKDRTSTAGNTSSTFPKYVALKRFCKTRIRQSQQRGSRGLELLRREVNIHSQ
jgi:hypothetical protein